MVTALGQPARSFAPAADPAPAIAPTVAPTPVRHFTTPSAFTSFTRQVPGSKAFPFVEWHHHRMRPSFESFTVNGAVHSVRPLSSRCRTIVPSVFGRESYCGGNATSAEHRSVITSFAKAVDEHKSRTAEATQAPRSRILSICLPPILAANNSACGGKRQSAVHAWADQRGPLELLKFHPRPAATLLAEAEPHRAVVAIPERRLADSGCRPGLSRPE
jgi:hypothetical protein